MIPQFFISDFLFQGLDFSSRLLCLPRQKGFPADLYDFLCQLFPYDTAPDN